jgi:CheY-like chemotaxis protein
VTPDSEPHGTETVLFVEDNDMVRRLTHMQLEKLGYVVHSFASGASALAWAAGWAGGIDLIVTDDVVGQSETLEDGASFLGKPFTRRRPCGCHPGSTGAALRVAVQCPA